ncbi:hypothetical protein [Nocardia sp. NPDC004722]
MQSRGFRRALVAVAGAFTVLGWVIPAQTVHADPDPVWRYQCDAGSDPLPNSGEAVKKCRAMDGAPEQGQVGRVYLEFSFFGNYDIIHKTCESAVVRIGVPNARYELIGNNCHNA